MTLISHIRAAAVALIIVAHTVFWGFPVHAVALMKLLAWRTSWKAFWDKALMRTVQGWIRGNLFIQDHFLPIAWDIRGTEGLRRDDWYMVICNHRSWADIPVILKALTDRVPFPKIFAKQQMLWIPIIGTALWALDYPFMKRYSRKYLEQHPHRRGLDLETTRRACRKYHFTPVTILNFIEGTRFTPAKHRRQKAPFRHLLRPKAGGLAFAIEAMEGRITRMLDVTIVYPEGITHFWSYLGGKVKRVVVQIREITIPDHLLRACYSEDPQCYDVFQGWLRDIWEAKDGLMEHLLTSPPQT
ncbi:MAG: acyltransferase [Desulfobacterales bacterium]